MRNKLEIAKKYIESTITDITESPEKEDIVELLEACEVIDAHYRSWCAQVDREDGQESGTTYKDSISLEYQIEAEWWHDVSLALRKLREPKE